MLNIIIYIVSTLCTYIFGLLSKKFKWNESLPIPIQNIIIGSIVFVVALVTTKTSDPQMLINQIIVALGGSGTAALGYDAVKSTKGE